MKYSISKFSKHRYTCLLFLASFFLLKSCSSVSDNQLSPEILIETKSIRTNLEFLASDELEGREAGTNGEKLSAIFIASELKKNNVKPFYNDYLQEYDLYSISADSQSQIGIINSKGVKTNLTCFKDFIPDRRSSVSLDGYFKLVFAGFGINAPEYNYNDFENINVSGKILVVADGEPYKNDSTYFEGEKESDYSKTSYKVSLAKSLGAVGIISISSNYYLNNWERVSAYSKGEAVSFPKRKREELLRLVFNEESIALLLQNVKYSYTDIKNLIFENQSLPVFELEKDIEIKIKMNEGIKKSYNIVGIIEGSDSLKRNEFVAIGAHYDHVGVIDGKVFNGADDNGSGTTALLEIAKAFSKTRLNERSILVVFHGAEEKGLLGSEYFTNNFSSVENIIAHINMDMVGREHIDTIFSVGSGKLSKQFQELVEEVNSQTVNFVFNYQFDDPLDKHRIYYRSDHYNYAKHNIPVVFFYDNMFEDYHKHSDEIDKINFEKIRKTAILVYNIALKTANLKERLTLYKKEITETAN